MHAAMTAYLADERAASLVEYAILVGLIAVAGAAALQILGGKVDSDLSQFVTDFKSSKG